MRHSLVAIAAMTVVIALSSPTSAQRRGRNDNSSVGAPIATNTVVDNPDAFYGKLVTISAGVEQVISTTAFVVDQRKVVGPSKVQAIGKPILVVAPYLSGAIDRKQYLLIRGEIVKLDASAVARIANEHHLDLVPDIGAKYQGQPVLLASSVINSTYTELAKKPEPAR
jgi:hypothetical protein